MAGRIRGCFDTASKLGSHNSNVLCDAICASTYQQTVIFAKGLYGNVNNQI